MKKLVLTLAVVFSMSFFACGNKEAAAEAEAEAPATEEIAIEEAAEATEACDSLPCDTIIEAAAEIAEAPAAE